MDSNSPTPEFSRMEIISRLIISGLLLFIAIIGYVTLLYTGELKLFKILTGITLILWGFKGKKAQGFWLNKWIMRVGGISLIISGIINYFN